MEVKFYREPENEVLLLSEDALDEYNQLSETLGLSVRAENKGKTPGVYLPLNDTLQRVMKALCPMKKKIDEYTFSTIPLEVLRAYQFIKENEMFDGVEVWYDDKEKDPLLIGWNWQSENAKEKGYSWEKNRFLIARWGDCAMEVDQLISAARARIKNQLVNKAADIQDRCASVLKNPDRFVDAVLSGRSAGGSEFDLNTGAEGTIY